MPPQSVNILEAGPALVSLVSQGAGEPMSGGAASSISVTPTPTVGSVSTLLQRARMAARNWQGEEGHDADPVAAMSPVPATKLRSQVRDSTPHLHGPPGTRELAADVHSNRSWKAGGGALSHQAERQVS